MENEKICLQCPRKCRVNRGLGELGFCRAPSQFVVARAALHFGEEPCISGTRGSGTVFFSGCNLRCVFCQNRELSYEVYGKRVTGDELAAVMLKLEAAGAHNINLVTPTPYSLELAKVLEKVKPRLHLPIVWNCGGYESPEALRALSGLVDIYLPDFKYFDENLSQKYSGAKDYFHVALSALTEMFSQVGECRFDADGILQKGLIVRHLVLPGCRNDSIRLLNALKENFGVEGYRLSLMSQYTPEFAKDCADANLHRRVTSFEYQSVLDEVERLGFEGYFQERESATSQMTPDFHEESLL